MEKVYCVKDYNYFEEGTYYYSQIEKVWSGGTYALMYNIYDMESKKVGEIGYLYEEVFEPIKVRRKRIVRNLLNGKSDII